MKKQGQSVSPRNKFNKNDRENPEGVSISKKSKAKLLSPGPTRKSKVPQLEPDKTYTGKSIKETRAITLQSPAKRKASAGDSTSFLEQTPQSLSQISSIMPAEDSTMMSSYESPSKKRRQVDATMELAVQQARGEPDGDDGASKPSPKLKASKKLQAILEVDESPAKGQDKENSTLLVKKNKCLKIPLKKAGKKLKSVKLLNSKNKISKSQVKKNFDRTLPNETKVPKKPKLTWNEKKKERKMMRNNYVVIQKAKGIWEDLRRHKLSEEKRKELCEELLSKVLGKVKELAVVHDSARVIQCLIQYGDPEHRTAILEEVTPYVAELSKNKYGKFIIRKLLKYGTKSQRVCIIKGFHGCIRKLIRHREAADIVNYAYNDFANSSQRLFLLEEFYGPAFTMFRTQSTHNLDDILSEQPDKTDRIMHNLKDCLLPLIDKQILALSMVHKIFYDFFKYADAKLQKDVTEALRESLIHMMHTKEGARVAMSCIWGGSAKDRKVIVKSLKGHVVKICKDEAGHLVLLAIFDCVDDTVLVQKAILDEMMKDIKELILDSHGRKVLTYLLVRRDQRFFCPDVIQILTKGDDNPTSKKDAMVRAQELRDYISDVLLTYLTENAVELLSNSHTSLLIPVVLSHASGNVAAAMETLANIIVASSSPSCTKAGKDQERKLSLVEDPASHIVVKKLLASDRDLMLQGKDALFSVALLNAADAGTYKAWVASNRGCFILIGLLEIENAQVTQMLITQLSPLKKYLKKMTFKGAEILLKKLEGEQSIKSKKHIEISL